MRKVTLTDRYLKSCKPKAKPYDVWDKVTPGLGIRVLGSANRPVLTFMLMARFPDKADPTRRAHHPTRRALGRYGALTLGDARAKARQWHELIAAGVDPKQREHQAANRSREGAFAAVAERFIKHIARHRRGHAAALAIRRELIPVWGAKPIESITPDDVLAAIDKVIARDAHGSAHALFADIRRLFNWCIGSGRYGITHSPCDRLRPRAVIGRKTERSRNLSVDEIAALLSAVDEVGYPYSPLVKLLLLCGLRLNEAARATWSEIDFASRRWTIPGSRMKSGKVHVVPLSEDAVEILQSLPRFSGPFIFSTTFGERPVTGFSRAKAKLDKAMRAALRRQHGPAMQLDGWVFHDLRRVVKSGLAELRVPDVVSELVLAHTKTGLSKVYDQFLYYDERTEALTAWANRLRSIERVDDNVIELKAARA